MGRIEEGMMKRERNEGKLWTVKEGEEWRGEVRIGKGILRGKLRLCELRRGLTEWVLSGL